MKGNLSTHFRGVYFLRNPEERIFADFFAKDPAPIKAKKTPETTNDTRAYNHRALTSQVLAIRAKISFNSTTSSDREYKYACLLKERYFRTGKNPTKLTKKSVYLPPQESSFHLYSASKAIFFQSSPSV